MRPSRSLSRGMRTKLALLLALSTGAELLILDEPMSGLDPAATEEVLQILVKQAGSDGTTVLFSSHQLADVEQIADHIAIVDRGRVVVDGALDDVRAATGAIQLVFDGAAPDALFKSRGVVSVRRERASVVGAVERGRGGRRRRSARARARSPSTCCP